jgi:two-component system, chemotaxis family, CheB/CheR fusion protein
LIAEQVEELQRLSGSHRLVSKYNGALWVHADKERIGQVLINLITNAVKYSPEGGTVVIASEALNGMVQVSVQDQGIGIPEDLWDKVFDRFFQIGNIKGQFFAGMGLELYITAEIVRRHGGAIWVRSSPNEGATFFFTLPLCQHAVPLNC